MSPIHVRGDDRVRINDLHVIPMYGLPHEARIECWCGPQVDEGMSHSSGARVWIHKETRRKHMGNFKIEIEAVGGHGSDRTAKQGEPLNIKDGPDKAAQDFVAQLASSGCSIVSATLTHWPDSTPIVDDLKAGQRTARSFGEEWQGEPILQFFSYSHLPEKMQAVSKPFCHAAYVLVATLARNPERTVALRKLLEAKDAAVRAAIAK